MYDIFQMEIGYHSEYKNSWVLSGDDVDKLYFFSFESLIHGSVLKLHKFQDQVINSSILDDFLFIVGQILVLQDTQTPIITIFLLN